MKDLRVEVGISVFAVLFFCASVSAQSQSPADALARYQVAAAREAELDRQIADLTARLAALEARARANAIIPPANNSEDVRGATARLVRGKPSKLDVGNMGYGTVFVFSCVPNATGSFTAYAFTAAHIRDFDRPFIDLGGRTNIDLANTGTRSTVSSEVTVLSQEGGLFKSRDPNDPSTRDTSVVSFPVVACPTSVISIASAVRAGDPVVMTGFPYTSPDRVKTQNVNCAMRTDGSAQPCLIDGASAPGNSGGPITRRDGQAVGIVSAGDGALTIADNAAAMREAADALCRTTKTKFYYYVDKQRIDCPR